MPFQLQYDGGVSSSCQVGQGQSGKAFKESPDNSKSKCQALCSSTPGCTNFDYTQKAHQNACRLYKPNNARLGNGGGDSRQYCTMEGSLSSLSFIQQGGKPSFGAPNQ